MSKRNETIVGYGGFDLFEECYGYNENACFIASTEASARRFMRDAAVGEEYRIEPVTLFQNLGQMFDHFDLGVAQ